MVFNFFKRKKQEKKPEFLDRAQNVQEREEKKEVLDAKKKTKPKTPLPGVLLNPHITEKAAQLGEKGHYVFRVNPTATKAAIKQSIEALYGVAVERVRLVKKPAKKIRVGRREGVKQGLKKAVVKVKTGEHIEVISR